MKLSICIEIEINGSVVNTECSDSVFEFIESTLSPTNLKLISGDKDIGIITKVKEITEI